MLDFPNVENVQVVIAGDVMLDKYWFGSVERISPEAPVPVIAVSDSESRPGGAANVACNVSTLGARATLCGLIGDDAAGLELEGMLQTFGITTEMTRDPGYSTIEKLRLVARNQQLLRADFEKLPSPEIAGSLVGKVLEQLSNADVLIISDYAKGALVDPATLISMANSASVPSVVDPKGSDFERYRGATILTPNEGEFQTVAGAWKDEKDMQRRAVGLVAELDIEALVVTRSEKGISMYRRDGSVLHSPARAREVFDVTGAGDTVVAILATCLKTINDDEQRLAFANAAAGVVVARQGTESVSRADIDQAIRRSAI